MIAVASVGRASRVGTRIDPAIGDVRAGIRRIVGWVPDLIFADPRLAAIYDEIDGDRCDLLHYEAIVDELGARSMLDIGCGTGVLGCRLAVRGVSVFGVDAAQASLDVARAKPGADRSGAVADE